MLHSNIAAMQKARSKVNRECAAHLGISMVSYHKKMIGEWSWRVEEMYALMDFLEIPYDKMHIFFPNPKGAEQKCICLLI